MNNLKNIASLMIMALAFSVNAKEDLLNPMQYTPPPAVYIQARKMLEVSNINLTKIEYSIALDAVKKLKDKRLPRIIEGWETLLSNVFNIKDGLQKPTSVLTTLCYSMTSQSISINSSKAEQKFRRALYEKCKPTYQLVMGKPSLSKGDLNFSLKHLEILSFNKQRLMLLVGNKKSSTTKAIRLRVVSNTPDRIIVKAPVIDKKIWNQVQAVYPGVSKVVFQYKNIKPKVEIINDKSKPTLMSLKEFLSLEREVKYEVAD